MTYRSLESIIRTRLKPEQVYRSFGSVVRKMFEQKSKVETHFKDQIVVGQYRTSHFEMCPKAQLLYSDLPTNINVAAAEKAAQYLDKLFALEKAVMAIQSSTADDVRSAQEYARDAMEMARKADMEGKHFFVQDHVDQIKSFLDKPVADPYARPSLKQTPEKKDMDIDNQKFRISRNLTMQRKLKIIDND